MPDVLTVTLNPAVDVYTSVARVMPTHKLRCAQERRDAGGGGINVARVVKRLGGEALAAYPAGGPIGELLKRLVDAEGVPSLVIPIAGDTRESFTVLDEATREEFRFVVPGPSLTAAECESCLDTIAGAIPSARYVVVSGSPAPGVPVDVHARLAAAAKAGGAKFVLDASGAPLKAALDHGVYLVKPNLRELQDLLGASIEDEADVLAAARQLIAGGKAEIVAVSRGAKGALLATRDAAWTAPAIDVPTASSVGAGDSFLAGLVWSMARGQGLEDAFRCALGAGAAALLTPGTELAHADDVRRCAAQAKLQAIG